MTAAVNFDSKHYFVTVKINYIVMYGYLSVEFYAQGFCSDAFP